MQRCLPILLLAVLRLTRGFDLAAYKQQYQTGVGASYKIALTFAADDIIDYLAVSPVPPNAENVSHFSNILYEKTQVFSSKLDATSQSSDELLEQLYDEIEQLASRVSGVEQQIAANEKQLQETNAQIQQTNAQLTDAKNQVNAATKSVQDAENALHSEERRVDKSRHCIKHGGWLGKKICQVVNSHGIDNAKRARGNAQQDLAGRQQRLAQFQAQLAQYQQRQAQLQAASAGFQASKSKLQTQLAQLNQARDNVNNVDIKLKAVIAHVVTLLGKSQVLTDVIKNLIDLETVINPLTAIADQVISYTANAGDVNYLNAMKQKIITNLPLVQKKLAQYALIPPN